LGILIKLITGLSMKKRLSICLEEDLIKTLDFLKEKRYGGMPSRSSIIEYYLKKGMEDDVRKFREEEASKRARLL